MDLQEQPRLYADAYTREEIALNKRLYEACSADEPDWTVVEALLRQGADPLGPMDTTCRDLTEHVYGELICDQQSVDCVHLPHITALFLQYGMDVDHPRIPYDSSESLHPMWELAFVLDSENALRALKLLLDSGLSAQAAAKMWGHAVTDLFLTCADPEHDEFWNRACVYAMKALMLCASYAHIREEDAELCAFIGCAYNQYDLEKFRNWDQYSYAFDTSRCKGAPTFCRSIVHISETASGKEIWKIGVALEENEL